MASATRRALRCFTLTGGNRGFGTLAQEKNATSSSQELINLESEHTAHNYHPVPIVFSQAKGSTVWDPEGNKYLGFLSAYSAVNQIMKSLKERPRNLHLARWP